MKRLFFVIFAAALLWSGYWFVGAYGVKSGFQSWFAARQSDGWQADYSDLTVLGFPNRFDTTFTNLALADPETGLAWDLPFFQILALSYKPNHVIAVWPDTQRIATPLGKYDITSQHLRASLVFDADPSLPLNRSNLASDAMSFRDLATGETATLDALNMAVKQVTGDPRAYQFAITADGVAPSLPARQLVDPGNLLPKTLSTLQADMSVSFTAPWNRFAIETARPQPTAIDLKLAQAKWGALSLQAAGKLSVDSEGRASGRITLKAQNWRDILKMATAAGALPDSLAGPVEQGLSLLSGLAGNPKTLDIPLDFTAGQMWIGPIPLGAAPVLRLR